MVRSYKKPPYPKDWSQIALVVKEQANYTCELCHLIGRPGGNMPITVHHKDHNTFNNKVANLQVLCARCHLIIEGKYRSELARQNSIASLKARGFVPLKGFEFVLEAE